MADLRRGQNLVSLGTVIKGYTLISEDLDSDPDLGVGRGLKLPRLSASYLPRDRVSQRSIDAVRLSCYYPLLRRIYYWLDAC